MDPYKILGISPTATDEEVKKAYRKLSKKYHPDANINNEHQAEYTQKFIEIQNAYKTIMDGRKKGFYQQSYSGNGYNQSNQYNGNDTMLYNQIISFIQSGRYQEALNVLESVKLKNGMWFYYSAIANHGLGNNITALELAQTALQMEPNNLQYIMLVQQLSGTQNQYRRTQQTYGSPFSSTLNCCYSIMMFNLCMNCCCGF